MPTYTVKEVAKLLKVGVPQVYSNATKWGGRVIPGTSTIRFFASDDDELVRNILTGNSLLTKRARASKGKPASDEAVKKVNKKLNKAKRAAQDEQQSMYRHLCPTE